MMGILAALVAFNLGGDVKDTAGIAEYLYDLPRGVVLASIVSLGLLSHGLWRIYESAIDPHGESDKRRIGPRIQFAYSGLFYGAIAYSFAKPFFNTSSSSEGESQKAALGMLLEKDWGI